MMPGLFNIEPCILDANIVIDEGFKSFSQNGVEGFLEDQVLEES